VALVLVVAGPARARDPDPRAAKHADLAIKYYNMGRFDQAIAEYEKAYDIDPDPLLLYNLGQAHRRKGDGERAIFFYRRYLQMAPDATDREAVQKKIAELERERQTAAPRLPPPSPPLPSSAPLIIPSLATPTLPDPAPVTAEASDIDDSLGLRVSLSAGPAWPRFSGRSLSVPVLGSVRAAVVAALPAGGGALDLGGSIAFIPVPYQPVERAGAPESRSFLFGLFAVAGYRRPLGSGFWAGGQADLGVALWSGLDEGNPFTQGNGAATGALPLPAFRGAMSVLYRISHPVWLWLGPAYQVAVPVTAGLKEAVSAVHLFEVTAGVALQI
jgi:tetratricopeptide (TPR) repeat protein